MEKGNLLYAEFNELSEKFNGIIKKDIESTKKNQSEKKRIH